MLHRPWPMLLALLPLIIIDQLGLLLNDADSPVNQVKGHIYDVLLFLDIPPVLAMGAVGISIVLILLGWHLKRKDPWRLRPVILAWIPIEGAVWSIPLLLIAPLFAATLLATGTLQDTLVGMPLTDRILISISAGLYEELIFRLVGIVLLQKLFVEVLRMKPGTSTLLAVLATSLAFAWYHDLNGSFAMGLFAMLAGVELGVLLVCRGFAVAVWTHVIYDLVVTAML
ncbi:MAG: CPBP family intramembrane metalloprotease [Phycisphaerales bacterium]|nr:CPBP family intramembrane metalloprotease [Phycisphaerales bacterium]